MTVGSWLVLLLLSFSHTLHRTVSQDSINLSAVEENNAFLATKRCDVMRCLNQRGLLLKICLGSSSCSFDPVDPAAADADDFSNCANRPCESKVGQGGKEFRDCLIKECRQFLSDSSLDIIAQDGEESTGVLHSASEIGGRHEFPGKGGLSKDRKTCISTCLDIAAKLGTSFGACANRLCSLNSSTDNTFGISKRWGSRVCMENNCAHVESDLNAYVACGMEFCG